MAKHTHMRTSMYFLSDEIHICMCMCMCMRVYVYVYVHVYVYAYALCMCMCMRREIRDEHFTSEGGVIPKTPSSAKGKGSQGKAKGSSKGKGKGKGKGSKENSHGGQPGESRSPSCWLGSDGRYWQVARGGHASRSRAHLPHWAPPSDQDHKLRC